MVDVVCKAGPIAHFSISVSVMDLASDPIVVAAALKHAAEAAGGLECVTIVEPTDASVTFNLEAADKPAADQVARFVLGAVRDDKLQSHVSVLSGYVH